MSFQEEMIHFFLKNEALRCERVKDVNTFRGRLVICQLDKTFYNIIMYVASARCLLKIHFFFKNVF